MFLPVRIDFLYFGGQAKYDPPLTDNLSPAAGR